MSDTARTSVRLVTLQNVSAMEEAASAARVTLVDAAGALVSALPVSGTVAVSNFPATQPVSLASVPTHAVTATDLDIRDLTSVSDSVSVLQATAANLNAQTVGNVASGATDTGNPVKAAGKYNLTTPTFSDGQRGDLQIGSRGSLRVQIHSDPSSPAIVSSSVVDDQATQVAVFVNSQNKVWDGANWDRQYGDAANGTDVDVTRIATGQGKTLLFAAITQGAAGTTQLVAADAAAKIKVVSYVVVLDAAGSFKFTDGVADLTGVMLMAANGGVSAVGQPSSHLLETGAINRALSITTVTGKAFGHIAYYKEA